MSSGVGIGNDNREIFLDGIDITSYVIDLPNLPRQKTDWGQIPSFQQLNINVSSDEKQFHPTHQVSILHGKDIYKLPIVVKQYGLTVWTGKLIDVKANLGNYRSTLVAASDLQQSLNTSGRLDAALLTPSQAIKNLLELHSIPTDSTSFTQAETLLNDIPVQVGVNPDLLEWQGSLADLISPLLVAAIGRLYQVEDGSIGLDSYRVPSTFVETLTVTDADMERHAEIVEEGYNELQGYNVKYVYGTAQSSDLTQDIKSIDLSGEQVVSAYTLASADYVGSQWVELSKRRYLRLTIYVDKPLGFFLRLGHYIRVTSDDLGIDRVGELIFIDDGPDQYTKLTLRIDKEVS